MFWSGAYVSTGLMQSAVRLGILNTVKAFAPFHSQLIEPDKFDGLFQFAAQKWNLIVISPQSGDWVGFWGGTPRMHLNVFERNSYSGITLEMENEKDYQYWSYKIWRTGRVIDWFISDLPMYFDSWRDDSIQKVVEPYLSRHSQTEGLRFDTLDRFSSSRFRGRPDILEENKLVVEGTFSKDIASSFPFEPDVAFASFVSYLRIPLKFYDYDPFNFGVYLDVKSKRISLNEHSELKAAYEYVSSIPGLDQFSFLLFNIEGSDYPDLLFF
jgi:hypothetical protein